MDKTVIELKELRIGNLLLYKGELVCVTMLSCDIDDEYEDQICFVNFGKSSNEKGGWNRSLVNDLQRIPLTPEWLERCGFIKGGDYGFGIGYFWDHPQDICLVEFIDNGEFRLYGSEWTIGKDFKFLHQLQNLYFALTAEELTIKETV